VTKYDGVVICIILLILSSPIDIPNFGGQHRSGNFPLTPPDSDGPDSPDVDQGKRIDFFSKIFKKTFLIA